MPTLRPKTLLMWAAAVMLTLVLHTPLHAQTCLGAADMDAASRTALTDTGQRFFGMVSSGDVVALRLNTIASLAANYAGIEAAVKDNQPTLSGGKATVRPPFLLKMEANGSGERAEFLCGVFGANGQTADSTVFVIPNLPPGNYAVVILDVGTGKGPYTVSFVLQQEGGVWKLGGYYVKAVQSKGHDGLWFSEQAKQFKAKGQMHNAWFYNLQAREMLVPVPFMSTQMTDRLYDEYQSVKPADLPPFDLTIPGKTVRVTNLFPLTVGTDLDVVAKYQTESVADTGKTFQDNVAVMKALLVKFPELRDAFDGVVARGVETSGRDYGTLLPMKDIH
ncbi:MAG TPA: hypothetical protein VH088_00100 [Terriglobales bacterium]|nr:hypothetical protein [Terriglobales bacterium]